MNPTPIRYRGRGRDGSCLPPPAHTWTPPGCQAFNLWRLDGRDCTHTSGLSVRRCRCPWWNPLAEFSIDPCAHGTLCGSDFLGHGLTSFAINSW